MFNVCVPILIPEYPPEVDIRLTRHPDEPMLHSATSMVEFFGRALCVIAFSTKILTTINVRTILFLEHASLNNNKQNSLSLSNRHG